MIVTDCPVGVCKCQLLKMVSAYLIIITGANRIGWLHCKAIQLQALPQPPFSITKTLVQCAATANSDHRLLPPIVLQIGVQYATILCTLPVLTFRLAVQSLVAKQMLPSCNAVPALGILHRAFSVFLC
jgi:hypothetical protein